MAEGLAYNYAAKQVDDTVLAALGRCTKEAQLSKNSKRSITAKL